MHSDWFNGIEILQGRWQHGEKMGYCYPSGLEMTLCKWDLYVLLVTKGLKYDGEVFIGEFVICMMMMIHSRSLIQLPRNKYSQRDELCMIVSFVIHFRVTQTGVLQ
jgi:hypothetical protein